MTKLSLLLRDSTVLRSKSSNTERCKRKPRKFIFGNYLRRPCILNSYGCIKFKKYLFPESWDLDLFIERSNIFLTLLEVCHWAAWKWAFLQKSKIAPNLTYNCKAQNRTKSKTNWIFNEGPSNIHFWVVFHWHTLRIIFFWNFGEKIMILTICWLF